MAAALLSEIEVRQRLRRRARAFWTLFVPGFLALLGYYPLVAAVRPGLESWVEGHFGADVAEFVALPLIAAAFAIILGTFWIAARSMRRFAVLCPQCGKDLELAAKSLATRRCEHCGEVILAGRPRTDAVWRRYTQIRGRSLLAQWLWCWPAIGLLALWGCPQATPFAALLGMGTGGWSWLRTGDRRYLWPAIASLLVLAASAIRFW